MGRVSHLALLAHETRYGFDKENITAPCVEERKGRVNMKGI